MPWCNGDKKKNKERENSASEKVARMTEVKRKKSFLEKKRKMKFSINT